MKSGLPELPVSDRLEAIKSALSENGMAVLQAPPGAGKTTLVPLILLEADWRGGGRIVLVEPRRLAARSAARHMASLIGEDVGGTIGYRMRLDVKESRATQILVVTEGVFTRMVLDGPELSGIAAVIFDEFHERSLDGDFGLALALDVRSGLRPDLRLLVMSATLDGARVAKLLDDAPIIESLGRSFPVTIRHEDRRVDEKIEEALARTVRTMLAAEPGSILAFLPGTREINRVAGLLADRVAPNVDVTPLYGTLAPAQQDAAIKPSPEGRRKVVLATAVAETSITIDGVTCVIDSGLQRLPKFEPASGLTRLETVRVSKASAAQRAGRAGRTAPGIAIRLWRKEQMASLPDFTPPEILEADLSGMLLDAAAFGITDISQLKLLDAPPAAALNEARKLLVELNALDGDGRLTATGKAMRNIALPVRLSNMVVRADREGHALAAAQLAVLLTERGLGGSDVDVETRWRNFLRERSPQAQAARGLARQFAKNFGTGECEPKNAGHLLLHAYPDQVAKARGKSGQFLLANGRGAEIDPTHPLANRPFLVIADMQGTAERLRILSAAEVDEAAVIAFAGIRTESKTEISFDPAKRRLGQRRTLRLGAITLSEHMLPPPTGEVSDKAMLAAIRAHGLSLIDFSKEAGQLRERLEWLHKSLGDPWPDVSEEALLNRLEDWLLPWLSGLSDFSKIPPASTAAAILTLVPHDLQRKLDGLAPTHLTVPTGSRLPIRYEKQDPVLAVRVQELFGLKEHPAIAGGKVPLLLELLSPAHRLVQLTRDLPGFWRGSWKDVRADMRGRYPKHVWPENPADAAPTARAKPRGT